MTEKEIIQELEQRVAQLEEQQEKLVQGAVDAQGRNWAVSDFLSMGLTRRQALTAIAAIASGATVGAAISDAVGIAAADASTSDSDGDVGLPSDRVDVFADGVDANDATISNTSVVAFASSAQTLSDRTATKIQIDSTQIDHYGAFDASNNQIDIQRDGEYLLSGQVRFASGFPEDGYAQIRANGSIIAGSISGMGESGFPSVPVSPKVVSLTSGDSVELWGRQDSGGSVDSIAGSKYTYLSVGRIG